jgi:hypothetical protein
MLQSIHLPDIYPIARPQAIHLTEVNGLLPADIDYL